MTHRSDTHMIKRTTQIQSYYAIHVMRHKRFVSHDICIIHEQQTHVSMKGSGESHMISQKHTIFSPETRSALDMPDYDNLAI